LRALGHDEAYLESLIAADPLVLGLDPFETGVHRRLVALRQATLTSPTGRTLKPDVVVFSETGHIVLVEVKLCDNAELRDRRVVAQVVEYAASVASLEEEDLVEWLGEGDEGTWLDVVRRMFPAVADVERLANAFRRRMREAEIHLVIACDGAPDGLRDLVRAVAGQAALGQFQLHVVELIPHVTAGIEGVMLLPQVAARTEIVARTAVTITYSQAAEQPSVSVVASSAEEVEQRIADVRAGTSMRRSLAAVVEAYDADAPPDLRTVGRSAGYRQIRPSSWPGGLHYEFLDGGGAQPTVGIELHAESPKLKHLAPLLGAVAEKARVSIPQVTHETKWMRGPGRVFVRVSADDAINAAKLMAKFIEATKAEVDAALSSVPGSEAPSG
jgi:hypothetical protein